MSWFRIDDSFWAHRKARQAGLEAIGFWAACGAYASSSACDDTGLLTESDLKFIANGLGSKHWKRLAERLVEVGLWKIHPQGYVFHDWDDYRSGGDSELSRRRERDADRKRRAREKRDSADAVLGPPGLPVHPVHSFPAETRTDMKTPDPELITTFAAALAESGHTVAVESRAWKELSKACLAYWPNADGRGRHELLRDAVKRWVADTDGENSWGWNYRKFVEWANKGNFAAPIPAAPPPPKPALGPLVEVPADMLASLAGTGIVNKSRTG